ncbi:hypothetical protein D3C75_925830 [compost metagenome]
MSADRVHHLKDKPDKLDFRNRPEPLDAKPNCQTSDARLRQWRIENTLFAEFFLKPFRRPENTAYTANILAKHQHVGISRQFNPHGVRYRLNHCHLRHIVSPILSSRRLRVCIRCL